MPKKRKRKTRTEHALESVGLGENEATLYALMLRYPKATVQELRQKSPFPRTMLYYVLGNLSRQGLVTAVKQKWRTVYIAEDPERLYDLLSRRQREFDEQKNEVRSLIPELRQTYRLSGNRPDIRMLEGLDQYKNALDDVFMSGADVIYAYSVSQENKKPGLAIRENMDQRRKEKGIALHILCPNKKSAASLSNQYKNDKLVCVRFVGESVTLPDIDIRLYTNKVLYTRYDKREPIALLIEDAELYHMQKILFFSLWNASQSII